MNILILVFTMLSLLTIMTYTRLQTFLDSEGMHIEYEGYMAGTERQNIDSLEDRKYRNARLKGQAKNSSEEAADEETAFGQLNILPLLKKPASSDQADFSMSSGRIGEIAGILERLITILYSKQNFYAEVAKEHPNLSQELIYAIAQAANKPLCDLKFTHIRDLANLDFGDATLREVFYHMLSGAKPTYRADETGKQRLASPGYPSLLDYLSVKTTPTPIRVWLARKALIQAIFRDPQEVLDRRSELYKYLKDEAITPKGADEDFKRFSDPVSTDVDLTMLDFKTSKTRPPND